MGDTDIMYRAAFYNSNVKDITLSNNTQLQGDSIFQGVSLDSLYLTGTASDEGGDILSNFFTLPWVLCHDNTVGTLIIDDVSRLNDIAAGGDVVHYDESTGESVLYRNDGYNWAPIITENGPVSVLFDPQSDSESVSVKVIPHGGKTIFPTPYKHGHTFIGWFTKAVGGIQMESNVSTFTEDTTLYAQWELADLVMCKIVYDLDGGAGTAPAAVFAQSNTQITLASYDGVKEDFVFAGWSDGTSTYAPGSAYLVNELNIVLKAVWVPESTSQDVVVEVIGIGVDSVDSADLYLNDSEIPVVILGGTFSMNTEDVLTIVTEGGYTYFTAGFIEVDGGFKLDPSASVFRVYILEELVFIDPNLLFAVIHTSSDTASLDLSDYEAYDEIERRFVAGTGVIVDVDNNELVLTVPPGLIGTVPVVVTLSDGDGNLLHCHILLAILPGIGFIIPPA